ncbi:MAG TPA: hemerythrin domain-containing protein [Terriglobales bacterium]|nr:hemerythrin domain-containing protein [Terriglobales bacterium]
MSEAQQALARAEKTIEEGHREIRAILEILCTSTNMAELNDTLGRLCEVLALHFLKEEEPDGFFASLAGCAPERHSEVAALQQEHAQIKEALLRLCKTAAQPGMNHVAVHAVSGTLVKALREHEQREHELARAAAQGMATTAL